MMPSRRHVLQAIAPGAALLPRASRAEAYLARTVRMIVPYTPARPNDRRGPHRSG